MHSKWLVNISIVVMSVILAGCGSTPNKSAIDTTPQFQVSDVLVFLNQQHEPEIEYFTAEEVTVLAKKTVKESMKKEELISDSPEMDKIIINIYYLRTFLGGSSPIASDSLGVPRYSYDVQIIKDGKAERLIGENNLVYNAGLAENLQFLSGTFRDKSDEIPFIEAIANRVVSRLDDLN